MEKCMHGLIMLSHRKASLQFGNHASGVSPILRGRSVPGSSGEDRLQVIHRPQHADAEA